MHPTYEYLGTYEELVAHKRYLDISILNYADGLKGGRVAAFPKREIGVDTSQQVRADEWARRAGDDELGILFGYAKLGCDEKSLLTLSQLAARDRLSDQVVNSKHLSGFSARTDGLEIRALFEPSNHSTLAEMKVSRVRGNEHAEALADFSVVRTSMSILNVEFSESKPSSIKLKITVEIASGVVEQPNRPKRVIEPQTWDYYYDLTNFDYEPQDPWFTLDHDIPNGTPVRMDGAPQLPLYWKDGKVVPFPIE